MGHVEDARTVLIAKEARQRAARRRRMGRSTQSELLKLWDTLIGAVVRYGYRPSRAFLWALRIWLLGAAIFGAAALTDSIKPNNAFVLRSPEWTLCGASEGTAIRPPSLTKRVNGLREAGESHRACYLRQPEAQSYPAFNALVYSADTLLPVVSLEMQEFWIPDDRAPGLGQAARVYLWFHIALGWALSLLAVAGFTGLVKSD